MAKIRVSLLIRFEGVIEIEDGLYHTADEYPSDEQNDKFNDAVSNATPSLDDWSKWGHVEVEYESYELIKEE